MSIPTIVCVDDERNILLTLRTQLSRHFPDCTIEITESAAEALELVDELLSEGVDIPLVIADQIMPGMKGDELLIELHTRHPEILKVMLTGQARAEDVGNVVNQGSLYRFIAKPWNEADLNLTVMEALRRYRQDQQLLRQQTDLELANQKLAMLNANLQRSNAELLRANRLKDEFLATISHELRTPINAILGMSECLQEGIFGAIPPSQQQAITTIEQSGQHLLALINDILDVSKITAGKLQLDITTVAIADLCYSSLKFVEPQALRKQIQLTLALSPDLGDIIVDERRMRQVLINLLTNAVKFTPNDGKVILEVRVEEGETPPLSSSPTDENLPPTLRSEAQGMLYSASWIHFSVTDTGIGIAPEDQDKLFHPFIQVDSGLNREYEGSGLGLTLVKQIVELHGGTVGLTSQLGQGSCFTVHLPYCYPGSLGTNKTVRSASYGGAE
jgi:signal transduction histidine kinase